MVAPADNARNRGGNRWLLHANVNNIAADEEVQGVVRVGQQGPGLTCTKLRVFQFREVPWLDGSEESGLALNTGSPE